MARAPDRRPESPYRDAAAAYDVVHQGKPYAAEARVVRALARRYAARPPRTLLDVACGSGRHLVQFARWFDCTGLDASPSMLARARRRVPGAPLVLGDLERFELGRTFDVITCLFSAIGYVRSARGLERALRSFARHLAPGGVVVVEPWLTPKEYQTGRTDALLRQGGGVTVLRMNTCERRRGRSVLEFHYLVGSQGRIRYFREVHDLGLFDRPTMERAFRAAGLRPVYLARGLSSRRGLYVGIPTSPARGPAQTLPPRERGRQSLRRPVGSQAALKRTARRARSSSPASRRPARPVGILRGHRAGARP